MIYEPLPIEIRPHSWWTAADGSKRVFVIAELPIDWDQEGKVYYTRVGLLEYGYDEAIQLQIELFMTEFKAGRLLPVNVFPKSLKG